jgi:hypothetical protein
VSPTQRRYLILEQGVGAAAFNFVLNAAIAWAMFRGATTVPLWGRFSIAGDTVGTALMLPLFTCLVVTPLARRRLRAGSFAPLGWTRTSHPVLGWLPAGTLPRALALGAAGLLLLGPATLLVLGALEVREMSVGGFVLYKAAFAAGAGAVVTPLVALWAIAEAPPLRRGPGA